jgi:hypothetical protein
MRLSARLPGGCGIRRVKLGIVEAQQYLPDAFYVLVQFFGSFLVGIGCGRVAFAHFLGQGGQHVFAFFQAAQGYPQAFFQRFLVAFQYAWRRRQLQ